MSREVPHNFLPRSIVGRGFLLVFSAGAIAFAAPFLFGLIFGRPALTWGEWFIRLGMGEFFVGVFATGCVGLLWAVATPAWLPALALRVAGRMALCLLIPWIIMLGLLFWP